MTEQYFLLIPPIGLMEVFETERGIDVFATLIARHADGNHMVLTFEVDGKQGGHVEWFVNQIGPINERAREALAILTGTHMVFTGPVIFWGVEQVKVGQIVAQLSMKGG